VPERCFSASNVRPNRAVSFPIVDQTGVEAAELRAALDRYLDEHSAVIFAGKEALFWTDEDQRFALRIDKALTAFHG
jgi:hypothetical protein